jgi:hypothetical protein
VHQYGELVLPLTDIGAVTVDNIQSTVVDTNSKTLPDDWMEVANQNGEGVGQYLFSFNNDSGRFQSVIAPISLPGIYNVKIYRYKDNVPSVISEGSLKVEEKIAPKVAESYSNFYSNYYIYAIVLFLLLILVIFSLKRRRKTKQYRPFS